MKRLPVLPVLLATLLAIPCSVRAGSTEDSSESGTSSNDRPSSRVGNPIFEGWYADPDAAVLDGAYWVVPTTSASYDDQTYVDAFASPDLRTWTKHPRVLTTAAVSWARRAIWAPSIVKRDNKYFLFFAANDIQSNSELGGIGVAVADQPSGPYRDHLGKPLINRFLNGAQPIDQYVYRHDDGTWYLVYGGWGRCNLARLNDEFTGLVPFEDGELVREITPEGYVEGPVMFSHNGRVYMMWSEGGWTGPDYRVAYGIADEPTGPFERRGTVLKQEPRIASGAGHNSVVHNPASGRWYLVYHRRPHGQTGANERVVCIEEMRFDSNGSIETTSVSVEGVGPDRVVPGVATPSHLEPQ